MNESENKNIIVIYHSRDMDGWASGAILHRKFPGCTLIGYDYGEDMPDLPAHIERIIMVDVCMSPREMREIASKATQGLVYIDHHMSSILAVKRDLKDNGMYQIETHFTNEEDMFAACELTWQYCYPGERIPIYVHLIGSADAKRMPDRYPFETSEIMLLGLHKEHGFISPETCPAWVLNKAEDTISMAYNMKQKQKEEMYEYCLKNSFFDEILGYKALCLETEHCHPEAFAGVYDEKKYDIMVRFHKKKKHYIVSIYSLKDNVNAAEIAQDFGGGGHSYAAGFQIDNIKDVLIHYLG